MGAKLSNQYLKTIFHNIPKKLLALNLYEIDLLLNYTITAKTFVRIPQDFFCIHIFYFF